MSDNYLSLKWGTLKAWDFEGNEKAIKAAKEYGEIGHSMSAAMQKDTPRQKELICEMIDAMPDKIHLDWEDVEVSKGDAKKYVMEYK